MPLMLAAVTLSLFVPYAHASSQQQSAPVRQPGPPHNVILPEQLIAGSRATLAVLDADGRLVPAVDLKLSGSGNVTTDATGRASFLAPSTPGIFSAEVTENGLTFTTIVLPVLHSDARDSLARTEASPATRPTDDGPPQIVFPAIVSLRDRFALQGGLFSGDAAMNRVVLGNLPALVLAASPVSLAVLADPNTPVGAAKLLVSVNGHNSQPATLTVVSLRVTGPANTLASGEKRALTVAVDGSQGRLTIEVRNLSPEVVSLLRGNVQRVITNGGEPNIAKIELAGVTPGDYSVTVHIVSGTAMLTAVETARQRLLAAKQYADARWLRRINSIVERIDRDPQNVAQIRRDIERLMRDRPQAQVADLLKLAWQALGEQ